MRTPGLDDLVDGPDAAQIAAGFHMLGRTGARETQLEHQKLENRDNEPPAWIAACWHPSKRGTVRSVCAGNSAAQAVSRLLEVVVDGGQCASCGKPTGITDDHDDMPAAELVCWYQYDPELQTYRRGCEDGR